MKRFVGAVISRLLVATVLFVAASLQAAASDRIVAIGDIHGALPELEGLLQAAGLMDAQRRWVGGDAVLVQTGDILDRGEAVREVMDLLMELEQQAPAASGRVLVHLGNHEAMNLLGEVRDVNPAAYAHFADEASQKRQDAAYRSYVKFRKRRARALGQPPPTLEKEAELEWRGKHPLGFVEYQEAMSAKGKYGRWLRRLPAASRIGDTIFVHGGISPSLGTMGLEEINLRVAEEIAASDSYRQYLIEQGLALPFSSYRELVQEAARALEARVAELGSDDEPIVVTPEEGAHLRQLQSFLEFRAGLLFDPEGPFWFRGFAHWTEEEGREQVAALLKSGGAARFVCGHTPQLERRITVRFNGHVFLIDTGMLSSHYRGGRAAALEIRGETVNAIYGDGFEQLLAVEQAPASSEAAAGAPQNGAKPD